MKRGIICIALILVILLSSLSVFAEELRVEKILKPTGVISKNNTFAEGLNNGEVTGARESIIEHTNLKLYLNGGRNLVIEARTRCTEQADVVGFMDVFLQRWNGSKWINVVTPWDDLQVTCLRN